MLLLSAKMAEPGEGGLVWEEFLHYLLLEMNHNMEKDNLSRERRLDLGL